MIPPWKIKKTTVHDFIAVLDDLIDERFPETTRHVVAGGDYMKDFVMELRQGSQRMVYRPYDLFIKSEDYEDTIEIFLWRWGIRVKREGDNDK